MTNRYEQLLVRVAGEIPGFQVKLKKESRFMRFLSIFLVKGFMEQFITTIGKTMYVPSSFYKWDDEARYMLLRHELVHVRQFRQWPMKFLDHKGLRLINFLIFSFCYLFALPVKWTMRAKFERAGYTQNILVHYELHSEFITADWNRFMYQMYHNFGGPAYFYMWNGAKAREWAADTIIDIEAGNITNSRDRIK